MSNNAATVKELRREINAANRTIKLLRTDQRLDRDGGIAARKRNSEARAGSRKHTHANLKSSTSLDQYIDVIVDPENASVPPSLQVPGLLQHPAVAWKNKFEILVTADANGELIALFRPGLAGVFAATGHNVANSVNHSYLSSTTGGNVFETFPVTGDATATRMTTGALTGTWAIPTWDSLPEGNAIIESMAVVQPIAASISATYASAPTAATGRVLAASIPGSLAIPPGNKVSSWAMDLGNTQALSYDSLISLEDAKSSSVLDGARAIYVPEGDAADRFRPTKYAPSYASFAVAGSAVLGQYNGPACDGDPSSFTALSDAMVLPGNMSNFLYDQAGVARTALDQAALSKGLQKTLAAANSIDCPYLVIFGDGLVAGAQYKIVCTQVMCGIADSRNWSLSRPAIPKMMTSVEEKAAIMVAKSLPKAMASRTDRSHTRGIAKAAKSAYHWLSNNWQKVAQFAPMASRAAQSALSEAGLPEVAGFLADLGSAASAAEIGALLIP